MNENDLLHMIKDKCLTLANELLDQKTAPTAATAEAVRNLTETAISVKRLNLIQTGQNRSCAQGGTGRFSSQPKEGN